MIFASIILGWIDCIIGLYASYVLNVPSGATIIFVSIMVFMLSKTIKALQNNYTPNWYWQLLYAEEYSEEPLVAFLQRPL